MGEKYKITRLYTDKDEMLALEELDAVSVCTWNSAHAPCTIAALNAGKHVLCEKPMATSVEDAIAMQEAARQNGKLLMIGFVRRFGNDCTILKDFIDNGGSYVGTCAGAYIASMGSAIRDKKFEPNKTYLNIWPGTVRGTLLYKNKTAMTMEPGNPLLKYYDFGGDMRVDSIRHNGGCFAYFGEGSIIPEGTEVLMRYDYDTIPANSKVKIHGEVSTWAYKKDNQSGRVVMTGSHPEENISGDRLEFMAAMVRYAMDGNGQPTLKGELKAGETREMVKGTADNDPAYTAIGDRQYHHFKLNIPKGTKRARIILEGIEGKDNFDLSLLAKAGDFAFHQTTHLQDVSLGCNKTLVIEKPKAGEWFVSVFCDTTVETSYGKYGTEYTGRRDVLNGVPYTVKVVFE
jgi:hypothetical protein